jgi:hypothetical protein
LKVSWHKTLVAALALGAAVFAGPVQALQCLDARDMGVKPNRPYSQIADLIVQLGKERIARARVIFKGRLISAVPLPAADTSDFQDFVLTYEVSEWKKGSGGSSARLLHTVWCDGDCHVSETIANYMRLTEERIYLGSPLSGGEGIDMLPKDLDGQIDICSFRDSMRPISAKHPRNQRLDHRSFLFLLSVTEELEKLFTQAP